MENDACKRALTFEERRVYCAVSGAQGYEAVFDAVRIVNRLPTLQEVRSAARGVHVNLERFDDALIGAVLENAAAMSLPDDTIYAPSGTPFWVIIHELHHQVQYARDGQRAAFLRLIREAVSTLFEGKDSYRTPGTLENEAQCVLYAAKKRFSAEINA
jgi:hypothetical protein